MKENEIVIKNINNYGNGFKIQFECGKYAQNFFSENEFFCEYGTDISDVKEDVLLIPFISNILPLTWMFNLNVKLNSLDKTFYQSIENIMEGYKKMYPMFKFENKGIIVKDLIENKYKPAKELCLFSGGVDAYNTLINVKNENLELFGVIGADIPIGEDKSIEEFKGLVNYAANLFKLKSNFCKSNFKTFLNHEFLCNKILECNDNYWHAFQHGIGLISLTTPISKKMKVGKVYIASSYSVNEEKLVDNLTCASHISIDNKFCALNLVTEHNGVEFDRLDKIRNICNYAKENNLKLNIHVCWETTTGINCCSCEKCYRTILSICALGIVDPKSLGFDINDKFFSNFKKFIIYKSRRMQKYLILFLRNIQIEINENSLYYDKIKWFKKYNLNKFNKSLRRFIYRGMRRVYLKSICILGKFLKRENDGKKIKKI